MALPRQTAALALAMLLSATGFWLGETDWPPLAPPPIVVGIVGSVVVAFAVEGRPVMKVSAAAAMIALYAFAFFGGSDSFYRAFNECVNRGEEVRILLGEYHRSHGVYPDTLNQLQSPIPCARIGRPTILTYERTTKGYTLGFRDWLVDFTASEDASFFAHK